MALVLDIIQGKIMVDKASRAHDLTSSDVEAWVEEGRRGGMENAMCSKKLADLLGNADEK